jgi:hypothetical protein
MALGMGSSRTPLEVEAPIGPRAYDELAEVLADLGYDPRRVGGGFEGEGSPPGGNPHLTLTAGDGITPDAANALVERVSAWIRQRPAPKGRFRRRHPRPITVTVAGPGGQAVAQGVIERA